MVKKKVKKNVKKESYGVCKKCKEKCRCRGCGECQNCGYWGVK